MVVFQFKAPAFTGKYASIRKDIWKGTLGSKFNPNGPNYVGLKTYSTERGYYTAMQKRFNEYMAKIDKIEATTVPTSASVTITHGPKGTYGVQWVAELTYRYGKNQGNWITGDRTTGMGYDKVSTAFASALNKSPEFMKILMDARAKGKQVSYGADLNRGEPWLPKFKDGVGMNSLNNILKNAGYEVVELPTRSDVYAYQYTLKRRRA